MNNEIYSNPLCERYSSKEMMYNFSPDKKFSTWRKLWIALAESEKELGLDISQEQIDEMKKNIHNIDYELAAKKEKEFRHDVMAHVHTFGTQAPLAMPIIHLGATSAFVGDNTDLIQIKDGLEIIKAKLVNVMNNLSKFALENKNVATLGFTHFQAAQLTTVGKRATLWLQSLLLDLEELEFRENTLRFRGVKGTTGTQASFKDLFNGDFSKVEELDVLVSKKMGFDTIVAKKFNLKINYDNFERESDNKILFSTRQSSFITKAEQLEIKEGKNDSDRGLLEMNFSLVKEVEIAGVLIWKSIEDINKVYLQKKENDVIVDYLFTSLYQASQGIERLFKILIQLIEYEMNLDDKKRIEELLLSHNHIGMYQFISEYQDLKFNENENKFITLISNFYNKIRYHRFRYSENNIPELELLQNFGNNIKEENFDEEIKHKYGKSLGKISHSLYECISKISRKLHIFVEELYSFSVAKFVFWKNIKNL